MNEHEKELCNLRLDLLTAHRETMEHAGHIIELEREAKALRVDAERYRWLRDDARHMVCEAPLCFMADDCGDAITRLTGAELDAEIDAARAKP
jgi:hypothetical protein